MEQPIVFAVTHLLGYSDVGQQAVDTIFFVHEQWRIKEKVDHNVELLRMLE
jgi:hypothetical protein